MSRARLPVLYAASIVTAILASAPGARAVGTPPPRAEKTALDSIPAAPPESIASGAQSAESRTEAQRRYAEGFDLAGKATKDLANGKPEQARKKFAKARKLFEVATRLDDRYYQAWNMLGYCARQCGDLKVAFDAYGKCLEIEPEYAAEHEYLGETYLKAGELAKAKTELEWLRSHKSEEADMLAKRIAEAEAGGGDAAGGAGDWQRGPADSTGAGGK